MAKASPQTFQKRQRERRLQEKADYKWERRMIRAEEKRLAKLEKAGLIPKRAVEGTEGQVDEQGEPYPNE